MYSWHMKQQRPNQTQPKPCCFLNQELGKKKTSKIVGISGENSVFKYEANTVDWEVKYRRIS